MAVVVEGVAVGNLPLDAADGEVHLREPPRRIVRFLAVDRNAAPRAAAVAVAGGVGVDELHRLHEHAGRPAARVVDPAAPRLQHLDQEPDDAARGVELAAPLALGAGEPRQEVFVDAAQNVPRAGVPVAHADVGDHVDELAEPPLVEGRAGVVLGQHILERRIIALDPGHRIVDRLADGRLPCMRLEMAPAGLGRHPEDVFGAVLVRVLGGGTLRLLGFQAGVPFLEGIGNVFEKDQPEDDVLVLGCVHCAAQGIGHRPQLGLMSGRGGVGFCSRIAAPLLRPSPRHVPCPSIKRCAVGASRRPHEHPRTYYQVVCASIRSPSPCNAVCGGLEGTVGEVGIAGGGLDLGMAEQLADHRQPLAQRRRP